MFSHLRAVLVATATLVLAGFLHSTATATPGTPTAIALVPGSNLSVQSARVRLVTGSAVRAITIGY